MTARVSHEPTYIERPDRYIRKRDGVHVIALDWSDGDVSWMLVSIPVISLSPIVGTCSARTFERNHVKEEV